MYSNPTRISSRNPLHLPAQNELTIMATPSTIRITPSTTGTAIDVATMTGGSTIVSVPPTTSNTPKSMNHHQRDARCSSSWRTSATGLVSMFMARDSRREGTGWKRNLPCRTCRPRPIPGRGVAF